MGKESESSARRNEKPSSLKQKAIWCPQRGPQVNAITADWCPILLYGGAKFGGKTDFLLGDFLQDVRTYKEHWQGIIFRRALTEFTEIKLRAKELFPKAGATWHEQAHEWRFPEGSILRFKYLEKFEDIALYEGHSYSWVGIDELGEWDDANAFFRCLSLNRYAKAKIETLRLRATCNPGGRGHAWIKQYFIDPAPGGYEPIWDEVLKCHRIFIPAKLEDNKIGLMNDPGYENRLMRSGSPSFVRAIRHGDWNVIAGAYFSAFSDKNIIEPFEIPEYWTRFVSLDPGSADPFCYTWWAVSDGSISPYKKGHLICYREWYGEKDEIDGERVRGLRLSLQQQVDGVKSREIDEKISYRIAGHDLWDTRKGPSDAELMALQGIGFLKAEIKRKPGWRHMLDAIRGENNIPLAYWFKTCIKCIQHIPMAQHDRKDAEDVEDSPTDHSLDSIRYAIMSRPFAKTIITKVDPWKTYVTPTMDDMWDLHDRQLRGKR